MAKGRDNTASPIEHPEARDEGRRLQAVEWTEADAESGTLQGVVAGAIGSFVVAVFFLVLDALRAEPLWTPTALGSALLFGETLEHGAGIRPVPVAAYTALHCAVFVAVGLLTSYVLSLVRSRPSWPVVGGTLLLLFAGFEIVFLSFAALFAPGLTGQLGAGWVTLANALAAAAMCAYLTRWAHPYAR